MVSLVSRGSHQPSSGVEEGILPDRTIQNVVLVGTPSPSPQSAGPVVMFPAVLPANSSCSSKGNLEVPKVPNKRLLLVRAGRQEGDTPDEDDERKQV